MGTQNLKKVPMGTRVPKCGPMWEQCRCPSTLCSPASPFSLILVRRHPSILSSITPFPQSSVMVTLSPLDSYLFNFKHTFVAGNHTVVTVPKHVGIQRHPNPEKCHSSSLPWTSASYTKVHSQLLSFNGHCTILFFRKWFYFHQNIWKGGRSPYVCLPLHTYVRY